MTIGNRSHAFGAGNLLLCLREVRVVKVNVGNDQVRFRPESLTDAREIGASSQLPVLQRLLPTLPSRSSILRSFSMS